MEYKYESDDFDKTLEPMVIINDDLSPEVSDYLLTLKGIGTYIPIKNHKKNFCFCFRWLTIQVKKKLSWKIMKN